MVVVLIATSIPGRVYAAPVQIEIEDDELDDRQNQPTPVEIEDVDDPGTSSVKIEVEDLPDPDNEPGVVADPERDASKDATPQIARDDPDGAPDDPGEVSSAELAELRRELSDLRARVEELEHPSKPASPTRRDVRELEVPPTRVGLGRPVDLTDYGLRVSGFLQIQYVWNQLSEDQLQQGGVPLNRDRFMVRRGRVRVSGDWRYFAFDFEVDGSTTRGPFVGIRQANVSGLLRHPDATRPPYIMVTAGLTEMPFGYEVRLGQREMTFMERSLGSLAFFPGPIDVGLRVRGGVGPFRYDVAVMNGTPLDDRAGGPGGIDPTRRPDVMGRLGFEAGPKHVAISGGLSFLTGTGFHAGQDATKNVLQWNDLNENGSLDTGEILSVPGTATLPSENFGRWAFNADLQIMVRSKLGWSRVLAEATMAQDLDRGLFIADPVAAGASLRHVQVYGAFVQDLTRWAVIGARYDLYDPNADALDPQRGRYVPADQTVHTISPIVGAILPDHVARGFRGRIVLQYDVVLDSLGRDDRGVPVNIKNDQLTIRIQGEFGCFVR